MWVFDATPLIYLAKTEYLGVLSELDGPRVIPERVHAEVVTAGLEAGYPDARRVDRAVESGTFEVVTVEESPLFRRLRENENLSTADAAVLSCAVAREEVAVMDETYGRDVAATEGIETRGTAYLVLLLVSRGAIDAATGREVIDAMLDAGWYCSPDTYAKILGTLDSLAE